MTVDKQLINKTYYKTLMEGDENLHPIKALGELYMDEQAKEVPELSFIRFAQGEVYFHNQDFEAAIFKWENISNEFEPWAKKNMADAYFELDLLSMSEELYKSVHTESDVLKIEILLKLFTLYVEQGKLELAVDAIKEAVNLNPDYPNVTQIARAFFEKHQDWTNALELAVNESVRTEDISWFDIIQTYAEQGRTVKKEPNYFNKTLVTLFKVDMSRFERLSVELWNSYKPGKNYFAWIKEINHILLHMEGGSIHSWRKLSAVYNESYFELINGKHTIKELAHIVPNHLINWMKISDSAHALIASASTLAWSEAFPSSIPASIISSAEDIVQKSDKHKEGIEEGYELFQTVINWAKRNGIELGKRFEWMVEELLDLNTQYLLFAGAAGSKASVHVNSLIGESAVDDSIPFAVMFKDSEETEIKEITDAGIREIASLNECEEISQTMIQYQTPIPLLRNRGIAAIYTPGIVDDNKFRNEVFQYLQLADSLLFVLDENEPFSDKELNLVIKIQEQAQELPIHFLFNQMDTMGDNQELFDLAVSRINTYFPNAKIFTFTDYENKPILFKDIIKEKSVLEEERLSKVLHYIRKTIKYLLERRVEIEEGHIESIKWNEEMVTKLSGAINQLHDLEEEKIRDMKKTYKHIKEEVKQRLLKEIPNILHGCSEIIGEDSDFGKLHYQLNEEMNKRIRTYLEEQVLPEFHRATLTWIAEANEEFKKCQVNLDEMGAGFNELFGDQRLKLTYDFRIIDDWRRDADRMTRGGVQMDNLNILLRFSPSKFILQSAGKLFGALQQNKSLLYNKYKQFIENEDYSSVAAAVVDKFIQPFDLFEKSIDRDINMFFKNPLSNLNETVETANKQIEASKQSLQEMRTNPELYLDPLTLFEVRLRQHELMAKEEDKVHQSH